LTSNESTPNPNEIVTIRNHNFDGPPGQVARSTLATLGEGWYVVGEAGDPEIDGPPDVPGDGAETAPSTPKEH